ncbi:Gfo/Idh/MocA family protein [Helicobacter trogontum]|uniref:Gfo/Idh/MocA family oxidoreductase n=1 Tax=Helicobacter trogontum TaxID=50960 RepID=A0A4U8S6G8_9HELI|nr:Gfo/Idh/MocA family oxidoreductase [Helicobacter trogontum]TLD81451.1 Gfo/Idh/MocA family oxidoreductase [Helicobacter trogontum]
MNAILIGRGGWGKLLETYIQQSENFTLLGVYGSDFDISLIPSNTQVAFIATPLCAHFDLTMACITKGLHVFVEKPTCKTLDEFYMLQDCAKQHNLRIYTDYIYLCSSSISYIIEMIKDKPLDSIHATITQYGKFYENESVLDVLGVHWLSVFCSIFPELYVKHFFYQNPYQLQATFLTKDCRYKHCKITLFCSLLHDKKARTLEIYAKDMSIVFDMQTNPTIKISNLSESKNIHFDEQNNIARTLNHFYEILFNDELYNKHIKMCHEILQLCCNMKPAI